MAADNTSPQDENAPAPTRLSANARREILSGMQSLLSDRSTVEGDALMVETDDAVALQITVEPTGELTMTWWVTAYTGHGHHRWRDAVEPLLRDNERFITSALGGGFLVEHWRLATDRDQALSWLDDQAPIDRVKELVAAAPEAIAAMPDEPLPDYLLPPETDNERDESVTLEEEPDTEQEDE